MPASADGPAAVLARICASAVRLLPVDGASVSSISREGHHGPMSATNGRIAELEELEFGLGEGPGVTAFRERVAVLVHDLGGDGESADRWPMYAAAALDLDVGAVMAFPLLLGAADIGMLLMYAGRPTILDAGDRATALRLADAAALAVLDALHGSDGMTETKARRSTVDESEFPANRDFFRREVYQAAGMAMVQLGVTIEVALARIRGHAFAHDLTIIEVARSIVRRDLRMEHDG
jgi:GAF domain-containing protein